MTSPNRVAGSLATHRGLTPEVARMLWERGGRQVRVGTVPPVTAADIRQMDIGEAAIVAVNLDDPDIIAATWRADRRVGVREALLRNSAVPHDVAVEGLRWLLDRGDYPTPALVAAFGVDDAIRVLNAHLRAPTIHAYRQRWAELLGPQRLLAVTGRVWSAGIVVWAIVNGPREGFCDDAWVDTAWSKVRDWARLTEVGDWARREVLTELNGNVGYSSVWLRRLSGEDVTSFSTEGHCVSLHVEDPELLVPICEDPSANAAQVLSWVMHVEGRMATPLPPAVYDAVCAGLERTPHLVRGLSSYTLFDVAEKVSSAGAASLGVALSGACDDDNWRDGHRHAELYRQLLGDHDIGELVVGVVAASRAVCVVADWLDGNYAANQPTGALVAQLVAACDAPEVLTTVAARPGLWCDEASVARAVAGDPQALAAALAAPGCPEGLVQWCWRRFDRGADGCDALFGALEGIDVTDRNGVIPSKVGHALFSHHEIPERLRAVVAANTDLPYSWIGGSYPKNPVTAATLTGLDLAGLEGEALLALADNEAAPVDARVAALAAVESNAAGKHYMDMIHERVASVVTDGEQMRVLARLSARVAGGWLAGAYESVRLDEDALPEVFDELVAVHSDESVELFSSYALWKAPGPVPGCVAAWVRQLPELLLRLDTTAGVSDVVATIVDAELGGDVEKWRLFVELADGSPSSIDEILALVAVSR